MLTARENERLTRIGPGTPAGTLMRRYWLPILLVEELADPDALTRVRILGEDFAGRGYPTWEGGGIVWAYLGPRELQPPPPEFDFVRAPATHRNVVKVFQDNNWLHALEGGIDSVHSSFLHNDDLGTRSQLRSAPPQVEFEQTPHGLAGAAVHALDGDRAYVRAFAYVMPTHSLRVRTLGRTGIPEETPTISGQIWVPIDDERSWLYNYIYAMRPDRPLTPAFVDARNAAYGRGPDDFLPGFRLKRNRSNDYQIDRKRQRTQTFSGIVGMNTQDIALQECMGPIVDRTKEHLAASDRVIIALRKVLLDAITAAERGSHPPGTEPADYRDVRLTDVIRDRSALSLR
jgi:phthalate 4,5-dioxygenase